jgi:copper chaperone NosL
MAEAKKQMKMEQYKSKPSSVTNLSVPVAFITFLLMGCNPKAEKINLGKDQCAECKMTIVDPKFGAEILTKKGKAYKFDDTHCIAAFLERRGVELSNIYHVFFVDYNGNNELVDVDSAEFVVSSRLKSPMGGAAAFRNLAEAKKKSAEIEGSRVTNWATLYNILIE